MRTYYFKAQCGVSVGCEHEIEVSAECYSEAFDIAQMEAMEMFSGFSIVRCDEDGEEIGDAYNVDEEEE